MAATLAGTASADPWAAPGDARLRHDLQLLADAGIIRAPLTSWPVSWGEIARDLAAVGETAVPAPHLAAALSRVGLAASSATKGTGWSAEARIAGSADPMTLRRFSSVPREESELEAGVQHTGERFAVRLQATVVADPADDEQVRADGSYIGAALGNWMVSAGFIERWWGPGWEGSLILGTNQRPLPSVTLERNYSDPFETKWLSWIGQWRLAVTVGQFENERDDAPNALLFGMRFAWKPHDRLEIGLSRSAQLCGDGRSCGLDTLWDMFVGNDNDQALEDQPGNQLGGFDVRWSMPWLPLAVYGQAIGEDEAGGFPSKYLGLLGAETWGGWGAHAWRVHVEYADTVCAFNKNPPEFGCAYRNVIYTDGYQYLDRVVGHAVDGDSEQIAVGGMWVNADGSAWEFSAQNAKINRESAIAVHSVAQFATRIRSADLYHRRDLLGGDLRFGLGYEQRESAVAGVDDDDVRGFVDWTWHFQ